MLSNDFIFSPLLLLPSIFPSIRVFSNELAFHVRWPKYWIFNFSISPSNEYSGLISFRIDWFDLFEVQGTLKSLLHHHNSKASVLWCSAFVMVQLPHMYMTTAKTIASTIETFVVKVMSLLLNMLSRFVIAFLPRSKGLLISWLQSPSTVSLEPKKIKPVIASTFPSSICQEVMGSDGMILALWMLGFKPDFSLSSFIFIRKLFSSFSFSVIRVVSSACMRLLIFCPAILIAPCNSSKLAFHMMYSAFKLNKQSDNIQPCTPFAVLNQSFVPCKVLTVASWPAHRFLRRQVRWPGTPISLKIFQFVVIHTVKDFHTVNEAEIDVLLQFTCFLYDPANVGNLMSGYSAFSKPSLYIWKFSIRVLLKPSFKDFEHNLTSMGSEHNCPIVWIFFSAALSWNWNENWPFLVLRPLLGFPNLLTYWVQHFNTISMVLF